MQSEPANLLVQRRSGCYPDYKFEQNLWKGGCRLVAGVDEAGRGAWAGPVSAGAVILPPDRSMIEILSGVRDSKLMTPPEREFWAPRIQAAALAWGVGFASAAEIDTFGILPATKLAAVRAIQDLIPAPDYLLTDYLIFPGLDLPQTALVKGDRLSLSISAASVLAKTARDALMRSMDSQYPGYHFARHKGYGTLVHREAIKEMGVCAIHRRSFSFKAVKV